MFADLNGWRVNGGTVPHEMAPTEQRPDLVVIDRSVTPNKVLLVELTVPWDAANTFQAAVVASQMQGGVAIKVLCVYVTSGFDQRYRNFLILGPM